MKSLVRALHEIPSAFDFVAEKKKREALGRRQHKQQKKSCFKESFALHPRREVSTLCSAIDVALHI